MELARYGITLAEVEREHILHTLIYCRGNRTRTAKFLGISIRCLRNKLHEYKQSGSDVCVPTTVVDELAVTKNR